LARRPVPRAPDQRKPSVDDTVREVTVTDVREACDVFRSTWECSGGVDGRVSLEVSPLLAHDTEGTLAEALAIWKAVDRPNLLVKIPATQEGLSAITSALAEGVSVNVTLIFSVERYQAVMVFDALERVDIDISDVFRTVEDEGVDKFEKSWTELLETV
jgi:transaldolase